MQLGKTGVHCNPWLVGVSLQNVRALLKVLVLSLHLPWSAKPFERKVLLRFHYLLPRSRKSLCSRILVSQVLRPQAKLAFWCILQLLIEKSIVRNFIVHPTQILLLDVSDTGDTTSGLQERGCSWVVQMSQNSQKDCSPWRLMKIVSWYWDCHRLMNYDTLCIDNKWINFFDGLGSVTTPQRCQLASNFRHLHQERMT